MLYQTHYRALSKALSYAGIMTKNITHVMRGSATRIASLLGASYDAIRQAGRWQMNVLDLSYLTGLPIEVMRVHAGFSKDGGNFYLSRAQLEPSASLCEKVFPDVDAWLKKVEQGKCEQTIAAHGFLKLMKHMRKVSEAFFFES
jgi:hypothetical protein